MYKKKIQTRVNHWNLKLFYEEILLLDACGHKLIFSYFYNMKITIKNPKLFTPKMNKAEDNLNNISTSTDIDNYSNLSNILPSPEVYRSKSNRVTGLSKISKIEDDFCSMKSMGNFNDHVLKLISDHSTTQEGDKKIFKLKCKKDCLHKIEVVYLRKGEVLINLVDENVSQKHAFLRPSLINTSDIVIEFFQFLNDFKNVKPAALLFSGRLRKRNNFQFEINYERIRTALISFFQYQDIEKATAKLNDFEYLYLGIFVFKKNFVKWNMQGLNFRVLQRSETKKRKEHFLKFILKKLFKYLNSQKLYFFGDQNKKINDRMRSIFFESTRRRRDDPNSHRMENLGKLLSSNDKFREFFDNADMDEVISKLFKEYCDKQMITLINNHIARLKAKMEEKTDNVFLGFVETILALKKKKLKNMWTLIEFKQAQKVLEYIMNN